MTESGGRLGPVCQRQGCTHLFANGLCNFAHTRAVRGDNLLEQCYPLFARRLRVTLKSRLGCGDRFVYVGSSAHGDGVDRFFGGWVDDLQRCAGGRLYPFTIDIKLLSIAHSLVPLLIAVVSVGLERRSGRQ